MSQSIQFLINNTSIHSFAQHHFNMMKYVLLAALVAVAAGAPQSDISLVASTNDNQGDGNYAWSYKNSDGASQDATGTLKNNPDPKGEAPQVVSVTGSFSYPSSDGKGTYTTTYTSDERGYRSKTIFSR